MTLLSSYLKQMLKLRQLWITDETREVRTEDYSKGRCNILNCPHQKHDHTVQAVPLISGLQNLGRRGKNSPSRVSAEGKTCYDLGMNEEEERAT